MKRRPSLIKIAALANALVLGAAFVGCPARRDPNIIIAPIRPVMDVAPSPIMAVPVDRTTLPLVVPSPPSPKDDKSAKPNS
jgi:hypothetical protein